MAYEKETADLNFLNAVRISSSDVKHTGARELSLGWTRVGDDRNQTVLDYLKTITSVTDQKYNRGKATATGIWRNAGSGYNAQSSTYYIILRLGWATTLAADEMMVKTGSDSRADARTYEFYWRNIASSSVNTLVAGLRTTGSFTNPTVQGEEKTGVYSIADIVPQQQEDGSYWISVTCLKVATITAIADLAVLPPVRKDTHDIENPFGLEGGYTAHVGKKPTDGILFTYRALSVASRAVLLALTDSQLQGLLSDTEKLKYEFVKRDLTEDTGNTLALTLAYQYVPLATSAPEASARLVEFKLHNQSGKVHLTRSWPRLTETAAHNELEGGTGSNPKIKASTVTDPVAIGSDGVSRTYSGDWLAMETPGVETDNDGMRIVQMLVKAGDQAVDVVVGKDPDHKSYEFYRWDASKTLVDAFLASSDPFGNGSLDPKWTTSEVGITKIVKVDANGDRSLNLYAAYITTATLSHAELATGTPGRLTIQDNYVHTSERGFGWNIPVANLKTFSDYYKPAVKVVNTKNEFEITRRDEHTFDFKGVLTTFVPIDSGDVIIEDTKEKKVTRRTGQYLTGGTYFTADTGEYVRPTTATPNVKVDLDVKDNTVGSKDAVKITTTFYPLDDGGVVIEDNEARTVTRRTGSHILAAKLADDEDFGYPATPTDGTLVEIVPKLNDVQTYDVVKITTVAKNQTNTNVERTGTNVTTTITAKSADVAATVTTAAVNLKSAVKNEARPDGLVKSEKTDTVATPWDSGALVVVSNIGGVFTEKLQRFRSKAAIPAATAGQLVKAIENELLSFDGEVRERLIVTGAGTGIITVSSNIIEWKDRSGEMRFPTWSLSADGYRITGYTAFYYTVYHYRTVVVSVTRKYSIGHPAATTATTATAGTSGGGTNYINQVVELGEGLFAIDEKAITTGEWTYGNKVWESLGSVP